LPSESVAYTENTQVPMSFAEILLLLQALAVAADVDRRDHP